MAAAILTGDESTGVSIMLLDKGMDTGPVLARIEVPIAAQDTTGSLTSKLALAAAPLLGEALERYLESDLLEEEWEGKRRMHKLDSIRHDPGKVRNTLMQSVLCFH